MKTKNRRLLEERLRGEINSLRVRLKKVTLQRDSYKKEYKKLKTEFKQKLRSEK